MPDLGWVHLDDPVWDADKQRVIGGAPAGTFVLPFAPGDPLPGEWWSATAEDGAVLGYARLDIGWGGDAEILVAVDPDSQEQGVGSFLLARVEAEAASRGINYVYNTIREHEGNDAVHDWLVVRGFRGPLDGDLRKRVGAAVGRPAPAGEPTGSAGPTGSTRSAARSGPAQHTGDPQGPDDDRPPGGEEQGGYVDVEEHRY